MNQTNSLVSQTLALCFFVLSVVPACVRPLSAQNLLFYSENFDDSLEVPPEWSLDGWDVEEILLDDGLDGSYVDFGFSGPNWLRKSAEGETTATLSLSGLPPHTSIEINWKLASIDSPDTEPFIVRLDDEEIFNELFLGWTGRGDTFNPEENDAFTEESGSELAINKDLGYAHNDDNCCGPGGWSLDSGWDMGILPDGTFDNIPHTSNELTIEFIGVLNSGPNDESFAIDDIEIILGGVGAAGDVDGNGVADLDDFEIIRTNFLEARGFEQGDLSGDGFVDIKDFVIWKKASEAPPAQTIVPEPTSLTLLLVSVAAIALFMRRRRARHLITVVMMMVMLYCVGARDLPAQTTNNFQVAGPADWNVAANWVAPNGGSFVPGDGFPKEVVGISNGGIAQITSSNTFPIEALILGEKDNFPAGGPEQGRLEISGDGKLRVTGDVLAGGAATGTGVLNLDGGSAEFGTLTVGGTSGPSGSQLNLSGNAALTVKGNATLGRITSILGPDVNFTVEGDLTIADTLISTITGPNHSPILVPNGNAQISGDLQLSFDGFTPSPGNSWMLIDGQRANRGTFDIDKSRLSLPRGQDLDVVYPTGDVVAQLKNKLIFAVDRASGGITIENDLQGAPLEINGYTAESTSGLNLFELNNRQSLGDGFLAANPSESHLSELNPVGSLLIGAGDRVSLGNPYVPGQLAVFGEQAVEDIVFEYSTPAGELVNGIVEYSGRGPSGVNNLLLTVDSKTGAAVLKNDSLLNADIDAYTIESASGSLLPDGWTSLQDQGVGTWLEANPDSTHLAELNPIGSSLLNPGDTFSLGNFFDVNGAQDLVLQFNERLTGQILEGIVQYSDTQLDPLAPLDDGTLTDPRARADYVHDVLGTWIGDSNIDGEFSSSDLVAVFVAGEYEDGVAANSTWATGDWNGDKEFSTTDLVAAFQDGGFELGPRPGAAAVPEPRSLVLMAMMGIVCLVGQRRVGVPL